MEWKLWAEICPLFLHSRMQSLLAFTSFLLNIAY